ncbi:hypothetical protein N7488_000205 [Penicillium malachiteum]|nr:hypothetical protein N7488_000205 [Penicillium malachiteum]
MTFEGLGLKHACCIEIDSFHESADGLEGRSEHEVNEILDEEKSRYEQLEDLVFEFETAFAELGLPIWEFLTRHWQPRMIKYLSHRDPCDKEHQDGARRIDVNLEVDDIHIPRWIHLLGNKIEEVDDESS